jgi:hypothetical protein
LGEWPVRAAGRRREETRELGLEEEDEEWFVIFQKCRDLNVMSWYLSNRGSNENGPNSKSVEFNKTYNFTLRLSFKRVKDLKVS